MWDWGTSFQRHDADECVHENARGCTIGRDHFYSPSCPQCRASRSEMRKTKPPFEPRDTAQPGATPCDAAQPNHRMRKTKPTEYSGARPRDKTFQNLTKSDCARENDKTKPTEH